MNGIDLLRAAAGNTIRGRLRTLLTALAIVVASFTLTLTGGVGTGIRAYIDDTLRSVGSTSSMEVTRPQGTVTDGPPPYTPGSGQVRGSFGREAQALTAADLETARALPGVLSVTATRPVSTDFVAAGPGESGAVPAARYASSLGVLQGDRALQLAAGTPPDQDAFAVALPKPYVATLGFGSTDEAIGRTVHFGYRDSTGAARTVDARVTAVLEQSLAPISMPVGTQRLIDHVYADQTAGLPADRMPATPSATLTFAPDASPEQIQAVKDGLAAAGLNGATTADRLGLFATVVDTVVAILTAFALIALWAASFGIINALFMAVQERTREIGLLKAHGMGSARVFGLFTAEAALIGLLGAGIGSALGIAVGSIANRVLTAGPLANLPGLSAFAVDPATQAAIVGLVLLVAFAAGTLPALRAARRDPISALRYE